jgi:hypothetical protein
MPKQIKQKIQTDRQAQILKLQKKAATKKQINSILIKTFAILMVGGMLLSSASNLLYAIIQR